MFWVLELISTAIQVEYDRNEHCILLLVLDIPNLLTVNLYLLMQLSVHLLCRVC